MIATGSRKIVVNGDDLESLRREAFSFPAGPRRDEAMHALNPSRHDTIISHREDGKLKGVASVWKTADHAEDGVPGNRYIRIRNMATSESGVGRHLLNRVFEHAGKQNAGVYLSSLVGSRSFYEKHGFKEGAGATYYLPAEEVKQRFERKEA